MGPAARAIVRAMSDALWVSGPWTGYYNYPWRLAERHGMDLRLTFSDGRLTATGSDDVGPFTFEGRYDPATLECTWVKRYATHTVDYRGFREGKGIWGTWRLTGATGGFHIWPLEADAAAASVSASEQVPLRRR